MFGPRHALLACLVLTGGAAAHEHHDDPAHIDPSVPIDSVLKLHMLFQAFVWIILFPLVMVLGLLRHRLHVPLAVLSLALTTLGYFLGHGHKGRAFPHTAHGTLASLIVFYLAAQTALGLYLKLHLKWQAERWVRPPLLFLHGFLGKTFPLLGWVQMILGVATLQSWCFGGHLGQCLAHYIMGSSFVAYSAILLIMLKAGAGWLARRGKSQEWFDSWVICLWGLVNSFTEHQGGPWTHKDLQHTLLGVVWFFGGAVGIWTSRRGKRSIFPGIIIALTGWAMSGHAQALMLSTMVHGLFGYALMAAGVARVIEVCSVLNDRPTGEVDSAPDPDNTEPHQRPTASTPPRQPEELVGRAEWTPVRAFQMMPPWLLTSAGILFMSATDEELRWANGQGVDHITWGLIDFSIAFFLFLWNNVLIDLYTTRGGRYGARVAARGGGAALEGGSGTGRGGGGASSSRTRGWYSRLSMGGRAEYDDGDAEPLAMELLREGANASANGAGAAPSGRSKARPDEEGESETHILFEEGDLDAEEIDPFDDDTDGSDGSGRKRVGA